MAMIDANFNANTTRRCKVRHLGENVFLYLKRWRGIANRDAENTVSFFATVKQMCFLRLHSCDYSIWEQTKAGNTLVKRLPAVMWRAVAQTRSSTIGKHNFKHGLFHVFQRGRIGGIAGRLLVFLNVVQVRNVQCVAHKLCLMQGI